MMRGNLAIVSSTVMWNKAEYGGGVYNDAGTLEIVNSRFLGNEASYDGGGVKNNRGTLTVSNSAFVGNATTARFNPEYQRWRRHLQLCGEPCRIRLDANGEYLVAIGRRHLQRGALHRLHALQFALDAELSRFIRIESPQ